MQIQQLERIGIGNFPTPYESMPNLSLELKGARLFVKRDDMTGLAMGGNKTRQLDYILVEAKRKKADTIITTCGIQSNWARQTVAAAIKLGMNASLVLRTAQFKSKPRVLDGNILIDHIMGADVKIVKMRINQDPENFLEEEAQRLRKKGRNPFVLRLKAAVSPHATLAYVDCVKELMEQMKSAGVMLDAIVVTNGSGPTHAGLILGTKMLGLKTRVVGINIGAYPTEQLKEIMVESAEGAARLLGTSERVTKKDIDIRDDYSGKDYGILTKESKDAIRLVARKEGLILDPVYTSKTMAGMIDLVRRGEFRRDENVCFVHTGGTPALFAYKEHFQPSRGF